MISKNQSNQYPHRSTREGAVLRLRVEPGFIPAVLICLFSLSRFSKKQINSSHLVWAGKRKKNQFQEQSLSRTTRFFKKRRRADYPQGSRGGARRIDEARTPGSTHPPPLPLTSYPSIFSANVQVCGKKKKEGFCTCSGFTESDWPVVWVWGESRESWTPLFFSLERKFSHVGGWSSETFDERIGS